ncbi:unnamed protein product [Caenorhabditis bovis]|uniref:RGS domain-containing protein n=1 Tax=Caenorhabditis bovis TaxID=2654633 RepID=A0A8S1F8Y6_9PELO|nr:unnamed protein product [Caenorhabditis bovis]
MEGTSSHLSWARDLDYVLNDRPALDAFREWLVEYSSSIYLDLYFAMRAYDKMVAKRDPKSFDLAKTIYSKFISLRTGICDAIPSKLRAQIGDNVRSMFANGHDADPRLFQACQSPVEDYLRRQHQQFVCSDEFIEAFNKVAITELQSSSNMNTLDRRRSNAARRNSAQMAPQLTAEALLKSRHNRQTTLGKLEKMYPPTRQPYVCNATTSHNDSAVSSSFSGDTPAAHRSSRTRHMRDEQLRENPPTFTLPRVEHSKNEGQQFDHSSESGRKQFVMAVTKKLYRIIDKMSMNDETEKKINDIEQCKYTTMDMVIGINAEESMGRIDEEEELDDYLKKLKDDSQRASATRSPHVNCDTFSPTRESKQQAANNDRLTRSMISYSSSSSYSRNMDFNNISLDTFAPPPMNQSFGYTKVKDSGSQLYDSSGFGSMAPSAFSASTDSSRDRIRHIQSHKFPNAIRSTPRKQKTRSDMSNLITISYIDIDGVPVVAHVPNNGAMTLGEFRRYFLLSESHHTQLFFRTDCEDSSARYQLLLIKDEDALLPIFEGRITAELR